MVLKAVEKKKDFKNQKDFENQNDIIQEVIQHSNYCRYLSTKMPEFHLMYSFIADYLNDDQNTCPLVLTGPSNACKSLLMALIAKKVI